MIDFNKAHFIKLGKATDKWEEDALKTGKIRFGWKNIPLDLIKNKNWAKIRELVDKDFADREKKTGSTNDFNALKNICEANENTVFITFASGKLYWTIAKGGSIAEDDKSKYLLVSRSWSFQDIKNKNIFELNQISGRITKYQGYMATCCTVGNELGEFDYLKRLINNQESEEYRTLFNARQELQNSLIKPIQGLIPKDFEILVDLIFRHNGWRRTSVLGKSMKFFDLVLEEPFNNKIYGVQIKSSCSYKDFEKYSHEFENNYATEFEKLFFVIHTPKGNWDNASQYEKVEIININKLSELVVKAGLIEWILNKTQ